MYQLVGGGWVEVVDHGGVISGLGFCVGVSGARVSTIPEDPHNYLTLVRNVESHTISHLPSSPITEHESRAVQPLYLLPSILNVVLNISRFSIKSGNPSYNISWRRGQARPECH